MKICNAMAWKDDLQARLKKERAQILQGLQWLKTGKLDVGNVSSTGRLESHRTELLDQYRGILAELDRTIADLEREGP